MPRNESPLRNIRIASPCSADWNAMAGDDRIRSCDACKMNVYNLSGMTVYDAENLLRNAEGRLCIRYFQRKDGTIITADCPVGWARVKQRAVITATAALSVVLAIVSGVVMLFGIRRDPELRRRFEFVLKTTVPEQATTGNISVSPNPQRGRMGDYMPVPKKARR